MSSSARLVPTAHDSGCLKNLVNSELATATDVIIEIPRGVSRFPPLLNWNRASVAKHWCELTCESTCASFNAGLRRAPGADHEEPNLHSEDAWVRDEKCSGFLQLH